MDWRLLHTQLHFCEWDDEEVAIVYNPTSGDTHLVDSLAVELLQMMQGGATTTDALSVQLGRAFPDVPQPSIAENVMAALQQLQNARLVANNPS